MSTSFTSFNPGDLIEDTHVEQFIEPIQNLESGAAWYREATNASNAYKVDFASDNVVSDYTKGLVVYFKASANNTGAATLTVTGPSGDLASIPIRKLGGEALKADDINSGQVVAVVYTEDAGATNPRFEMIGGGLNSPVAVIDGGTGATSASAALANLGAAPASHTHTIANVTSLQSTLDGKQSLSEKGMANGYASLNGAGQIPAAQLPSGGGGGASDLDDLTDVAISSPASGQVLRYNGSNFVNAVMAINDVDGLSDALGAFGDDPFAGRPPAQWVYTGDAQENSIYFVFTGGLSQSGQGSYSGFPLSSTDLRSRTRRVEFVGTGTTVSGFYSYPYGAVNHTHFYLCHRFFLGESSTVTGARKFIGLTAETGSPTNVEPTSIPNIIGVAQLSTDDTQWYLVWGDGTTTQSQALGIAIDPDPLYTLEIISQASGAFTLRLSTSDNTEATVSKTSGGPPSTTKLYSRVWSCGNAGGAPTNGFEHATLKIESLFG